MIVACGSQTYVYLPFFSVTFQVEVPVPPTDVVLLTPGPLRRKLWILDLYETTSLACMIDACRSHTTVYLPFFSVTFQVEVPVPPTDVVLLTPGPLRRK